MSRMHTLKCWPSYFTAMANDDKRFEIRENDRDFEVGDVLRLKEWEPTCDPTYTDLRRPLGYTGAPDVYRVVTYIAQGVFGLPPNVCVMSVRVCSEHEFQAARKLQP